MAQEEFGRENFLLSRTATALFSDYYARFTALLFSRHRAEIAKFQHLCWLINFSSPSHEYSKSLKALGLF